jgi:hypothetical protein
VSFPKKDRDESHGPDDYGVADQAVGQKEPKAFSRPVALPKDRSEESPQDKGHEDSEPEPRIIHFSFSSARPTEFPGIVACISHCPAPAALVVVVCGSKPTPPETAPKRRHKAGKRMRHPDAESAL